jgi:WhiB family redox-sensing transcriptional regulator
MSAETLYPLQRSESPLASLHLGVVDFYGPEGEDLLPQDRRDWPQTDMPVVKLSLLQDFHTISLNDAFYTPKSSDINRLTSTMLCLNRLLYQVHANETDDPPTITSQDMSNLVRYVGLERGSWYRNATWFIGNGALRLLRHERNDDRIKRYEIAPFNIVDYRNKDMVVDFPTIATLSEVNTKNTPRRRKSTGEARPGGRAKKPAVKADFDELQVLKRDLKEALDGGKLSWRASANCRGIDPDLFFSKDAADVRTAKAACRDCVVKVDCLEYALANNEEFGIWGGMSERERRRIRRQRALARAATNATP